MKKYIRTIFITAIMAMLCIGFFMYLSNREPSQTATEKDLAKQEVDNLTTIDIEKNYPESPKEVIKLYARITKAYYKGDLTDAKIEALGKQARILFDSELKGTQTDSEFLKALKADIESYKSAGRYVSDYSIEDRAMVNYSTFQGRKYAFIVMTYTLRENDKLIVSRTKYTLRQDDKGRWKILFWELA